MSSPERQRPLESVAEVAEVLKRAIAVARSTMEVERRNVSMWGVTGPGSAEQVPDSADKGVILRTDMGPLNNIAVEGMTPQEAVQAALSQVLGEACEILADAPEQNLYVVECDFAAGNMVVPTLRLQKIEKTDDALAAVGAMYDSILDEPTRPDIESVPLDQVALHVTGVGRGIIDELLAYARGVCQRSKVAVIRTTPPSIHIGEFLRPTDLPMMLALELKASENARALKNIAEAHPELGLPVFVIGTQSDIEQKAKIRERRLAGLDNVRAAKQELEAVKADGNKPPLLVWHAGVTDMTASAKAFSPVAPIEGGKFHLVKIPPRRDVRPDKGPDAQRAKTGAAVTEVAAV